MSTYPKKRKAWFEKYGPSLKLFLPFRVNKKDEAELSDEKIGCISYFSLNWMNSLMWRARKGQLNFHHVNKIENVNSVKANVEKLQRLWDEELKNDNTISDSLLLKIICKWHFPRYIFALTFILSMATANYIGPTLVMKQMLECLDDPKISKSRVTMWAVVFSVTQLVRHIMFNAFWVTTVYAGIKVVAALQGKIYNSIITAKSAKDIDPAEVANFLTLDMERIFQLCQTGLLIIPSTLVIIIHIVYCYYLLGPWSLLGNIFMLLYVPIMLIITKLATKFLGRAAVKTDQRIGMMNQLLHNIKFIKIMAWEHIFSSSVTEIRRSEMRSLSTVTLLQSYSWSMIVIAGNLALTVSVIGYLMTGGVLRTIQVLNLMAAFVALPTPLGVAILAIKALSEGLTSCTRVQRFLAQAGSQEVEINATTDNNLALSINNIHVNWCKVTEPIIHMNINNERNDSLNLVLSQINVNIEKGQLIGICGRVGSGKTTLLSTICGSTTIVKGNIDLSGKIAVVTQRAWIFNGTVKQNILFGQQFESAWYHNVISACSLDKDLQLMPAGDETKIGERGSNLSGGQKQRINLARALYSNRDVYLLDDPFSAIDAKVAQHIFQECIQKFLRHKTVLLVTHFPHYLQLCDYIVVLHQGNVIEQGTHSLLMNNSNKYSRMVNQNLQEKQNNTENCKDDEVSQQVPSYVNGSTVLF